METFSTPENLSDGQKSSDVNWPGVYHQLTGIVTFLVSTATLPLWKGQKEDVVADIVQMAAVRIWWRIRQGESGELSPVRSVEGLCVSVARSCFIDKIRSDQRIIPASALTTNNELWDVAESSEENYTEVALDNVYTAGLFQLVAAEAQQFSPKLRRALLVDLANRMSFSGEATALQQAFYDAGIDLAHYRCPKPADRVTYSRQASLASMAYKRLREADNIRKYA